MEPKVSGKVGENEASRSRCEDVSGLSGNQQEPRSGRLKEPSIGLKKGLDLLDSLLVDQIPSLIERGRFSENERSSEQLIEVIYKLWRRYIEAI